MDIYSNFKGNVLSYWWCLIKNLNCYLLFIGRIGKNNLILEIIFFYGMLCILRFVLILI